MADEISGQLRRNEKTHAKRRRAGPIHRAALEFDEFVLAPLDEAGAHRRGGPEQVEHPMKLFASLLSSPIL